MIYYSLEIVETGKPKEIIKGRNKLKNNKKTLMKKLSITKRKPDSKEITPYEQGLSNFQELMNRFFDDPWFRMPSIFGQSLMDRNAFDGWWPKADVSENDKEIKIKMNVPGVDPEKINIEADADAIVISGSVEKEEEQEGEDWYRAEREFGEFRRAFELPNGCDVENIEASAKHGTLTIKIPKKPEAQKNKISVKVNG